MYGNVFGSTKTIIGQSFPAWKEIRGKETAGGVLNALPAVGTVIPAGSMVSLDGVGGTAKIVKSWIVAASATNSATEIKVKLASIFAMKPVVGEFLMIAPSTATATGQGALINAAIVDTADTSGLTYTLTLAATLGTALTTSTILVQATSATASASVYAVPTGFLENDIYIKQGASYATATSVYDGSIWETRNSPVPACFKVLLPMIKFEKEL